LDIGNEAAVSYAAAFNERRSLVRFVDHFPTFLASGNEPGAFLRSWMYNAIALARQWEVTVTFCHVSI
jgi:hypothetical protein